MIANKTIGLFLFLAIVELYLSFMFIELTCQKLA